MINMFIDIEMFMLISQQQFNTLIDHLKLDLTTTSDMYLLTYLFANFLAYFLIILVLYLAYRIVHSLMPWNWQRRYKI